jgi:DNA-binding beta-propeller fold protein YncE
VVSVAANGAVTLVAGAARFRDPRGIAVAPDGTCFVADTGNAKIKTISPSGQVTTLAGGDVGYADGQGAAAEFSQPMGVARLPNGTIVVADPWNQRLRAITPSGAVSTWCGNGQIARVDGACASASLYYPFDVAALADGSVIVVEADTGVIRRVSGSGASRTIQILAGGVNRSGWADGTLDVAAVQETIGVGAAGNDALLLDGATARVRIAASGANTIETLAGGTTAALIDGAGDTSGLYFPRAATGAPDGSILVVDTGHHALRRITY